MSLRHPLLRVLVLLVNTVYEADGSVVIDEGYCNWGPEGTAVSSTCDGCVQGGSYCNTNAFQCEESCSGKWCTNTIDLTCSDPVVVQPTTPSPPSLPPPTTPPPPSISTNTATTTRYWDCSGGSCGCAYLPLGSGTDDEPAHCHSNALFSAPGGNPFGAKYYGAAAVSPILFGGASWLGDGCGKCWKVVGRGNVGPRTGVVTTLVLKGTNLCPTDICLAGPHFDIAAPGFDVAEFSWSNTCATREPREIEGFKACGRWMIDSQNYEDNCDCSQFVSPVLRAGCENFLGLGWNNPSVDYEEVNCPPELRSLPCWEENGNGYPQDGVPEMCMDPNGDPDVMLPFPNTAPTTVTPVLMPSITPPPVAPTASPITLPTLTETSPPTNTPHLAPVAMPSPTSGSSMCCIQNFKDCIPNVWCNESQTNCEGSCGGKWSDVSAVPRDCIARYGMCMSGGSGDPIGTCCPGLTCKGDQWWASCVV